jgi:hypothetical protein
VETSRIAENVKRITERIARAAERAGRRPSEVTLVAVSKTFPAEAIRAAYAAGVRHFGENRVQEWEGKQPLLADLGATWHLVGHLQSNKARRAARLFHTVDSLDRLELARKLDRALAEMQQGESQNTENPRAQSAAERRLKVLIEVRLAPEKTKSGVAPEGLFRLTEGVLALPHLDPCGLMCIPPLFEDVEKARPFFRRLRELRDHLRARYEAAPGELSMGMSHDFEVAIEEGATQVRLGTAIFGERGS